jgi:hypothetical protein
MNDLPRGYGASDPSARSRSPATVTPGAPRRSCRIAGRSADGSVMVFARPGPQFMWGDQTGKGCESGVAECVDRDRPPIPRRGLPPLLFRLFPPRGEGETGGGAGAGTAPRSPAMREPGPTRDSAPPCSSRLQPPILIGEGRYVNRDRKPALPRYVNRGRPIREPGPDRPRI